MGEEYSFGAWIRRRRRALDLTQQELARRINCSLSTVAKIESDQRRPSRQIAELLARQLNIAENQVDLFIKVARGLRSVDQMPPPAAPETPVLPPAAVAPCAVPVPLTRMVGREVELAEIVHLLELPECRLLTIAGLGGIGKTRLALQVAHNLSAAPPSHFADGVFFVPLASVVGPRNIPKAIARAIGFDFSGSSSPEDQLIGFLHKKQGLLVLDNVEHLLAGVDLLSRILEKAPGLKFLVTSRERLELSGEWVLDLRGLPVPPVDAGGELENYSAAELFLDRARQVQNDFSPEAGERSVVAHICRLLDGIPLAIELAATWVRTVSVGEIAVEITRDLDFLTTTDRDVPERQRSLRVVFDHSWSLLSPAEQSALCRLSVFQGGFTREAAEAVAQIRLPLLQALIDKSLLRRSTPARYDLHELVRGHAAARLAEQPDGEGTRERHSRFFLSLVRDSGPDLHSCRQRAVLTKLSSELANIRSAWTWALERGRIGGLVEAARSLWYLFELLNYYREAEDLFGYSANVDGLTPAGKRTGETDVDRQMVADARGQFLMHQAYFAMRLNQIDRAETCCQASIAELRSAHNPEALAHALTYYAVLNWMVGDLDRASDLLQESLPLSKVHGRPWQIALLTAVLGNVAYERGAYGHSYRLLREALERAQAVGDPRLIGYASAYVGRTALKLGRTAEIEPILKAGARLAQAAGDRFCYGLILEQLALASQIRGDMTTAEELCRASVDLFRESGDAWNLARVLTSWGNLTYARGDLPQAADRFRQAVESSLEARASLIIVGALVGLARVHREQDQPDAALEIACLAMDHPAATADARSGARELYRELAAKFEPGHVAAVERRVRSATVEEYAREHLSEHDPD